MVKDNVTQLKELQNNMTDVLTDIARQGAQEMLATAIEAEVKDFLARFAEQKDSIGNKRVVRNGYLPGRNIQTGIGDIPVKVPRVRDRGDSEETIKFNSVIVPPYLRRSKTIESLLPLLYLKGISTGSFQETLSPLVGEDAKNLSPGVISRLKSGWESEYNKWNRRDLSLRSYVYFWADGIYLKARMDNARDCVLVIIGVNEKGEKELVAISDGYRESKESWQELLRDLKQRGLKVGPKLAVGDGALGFWAALAEEYSETRHQRCWQHKSINVLDKLPKSLHAKAKQDSHEIWMAADKVSAEAAFDNFIKIYETKYPKATRCLTKDRDELLTFYDFPAEHWKSLRTTNPIESTFATVRHRTKRARGCFSRATILTMVFKLCQSANKNWKKLYGFKLLADVIEGIKFVDGVRQEDVVMNIEATI